MEESSGDSELLDRDEERKAFRIPSPKRLNVPQTIPDLTLTSQKSSDGGPFEKNVSAFEIAKFFNPEIENIKPFLFDEK